MKTKIVSKLPIVFTLFALIVQVAFAQGTAFTYDGRLNVSGSPANGTYDVQFSIYDSVTGGNQQGNPVTNSATGVTNGLFTATLDFGAGVFAGAERWLEIGLRTNGTTSAFQILSPRQLITSVPYAIRSLNATSFNGPVSDSQLSGNVARLDGNQTFTGTINFTSTSNDYAGNFSGNGIGLTNLPTGSVNLASVLAWPAKFVNASTVSVFSYLNSVAAADANGDGRTDLIAAGGSLLLLTNNGSGGFTIASNISAGVTPWYALAVDLNGDGTPDLAVANLNIPGTVTTLTNLGAGGGYAPASTNAVGDYPYSLATADFNGDGKPDLVSANFGSATLSVLTNRGDASFALAASPVVGTNCYAVAAADINGDGKPDVIAANWDTGTLIVLTNSPGGGFTQAYTLGAGSGVIAVIATDINGDGRADLISASFNGANLSVYTNNGSGGFTLASSPAVGLRPDMVTAADVNADGRPDLISANYLDGTLSVLTNKGSGQFALAETLPVGNAPRGLVAADINGDAEPDLIAANDSDQTLSVFFNSPVLAGDASGVTNFPANVALRTGGNSFTGSQTITGGDAGQLTLVNNDGRYWYLYTEHFNNSGYLIFQPNTGVGGYIRRTDGNYVVNSDARLKREITPMSGVLDRVLQLRPVTYRFQRTPEDTPRTLGLIAQEVEPLFPEVISEHNGMKGVAYSELIPVTIGALQDLNRKMESENTALRDALKYRDAEDAELKKRLDGLENLIRSQKSN